MKQTIVYWKTFKAGILTESDEGYSFVYDNDYLRISEAQLISLTITSILSHWLMESAKYDLGRLIMETGLTHKTLYDKVMK